MTYKPDFKKAYILANDILLKSQQISDFPFSVTKVIREISDVQCCSFERAQKHRVNIEAFGSDTAILTEYDGKWIIFYNQLDVDERIRFSMLHEIGHYLLEHNLQTDDKALYEKQEIETNFFTAQLLMPDQILWELQRRGKCMDADFLTETFNVSKVAAGKRLETIQKRKPDFRSKEERECDDLILLKYKRFLDGILSEKKGDRAMPKKQRQDYSFIPRSTKTAEKVKEDYRNYEISPSAGHIVFEAARNISVTVGTKKNREHVKIYKDKLYDKDRPAEGIRKGALKHLGIIHFTKAGRQGVSYRKFDLEHDMESASGENDNSPTLKELHFGYSVAGSDEIGNGDVFKPIIVTASYVTPVGMEKLLELNVRDSKQVKSKTEMVEIGAALTGIYNFSEVVDGAVIETEYLTFCSRILSNTEYDRCQQKAGTEKEKEKNKNDLLREFHADALNALISACHPDYIMVDDFMNGSRAKYQEFFEILDFEKEKVFLRKKADALNMAVSAASIISSYLGSLYLLELNAQLKEQYGMTGELQAGADLQSEAYAAPLKELRGIMEKRGENFEDFMKKYAKTTFKNVSAWINGGK